MTHLIRFFYRKCYALYDVIFFGGGQSYVETISQFNGIYWNERTNVHIAKATVELQK